VKVVEEGSLKTSLEAFRDYISAEILADELEFVSDISGGTDIEINDIVLKTIVLKKG